MMAGNHDPKDRADVVALPSNSGRDSVPYLRVRAFIGIDPELSVLGLAAMSTHSTRLPLRAGQSDTVLKALRQFGLTYPGVAKKSPWPGHDDLAVNDKTFAYLSSEGQPFSISVKLPFAGAEAMKLPFAKPTGYGLGKSGWVTFEPTPAQMPSLAQLKSWMDESYRAQAPKKLARQVTNEAAPRTRSSGGR